MDKKAFLILACLVTLVFTYSCNKTKNGYKSRYTLAPTEETIEIKLRKESKNYSPSIQYLQAFDSNYLYMANHNRNSIEVYNLDTRKLIKEVKINREGTNSFGNFLGFVVKNFDTIIVINQMPQLIGLVNPDGEILKKISYSQDINGRRIQSTNPRGGSRAFFIDNDLYVSQIYRADESSGIFTSEKQKHSYLNFKVDIKKGQCQFLPLVYPKEIIDQDISYMNIWRTAGFNNDLVYTFGIMNNILISHDSKFEIKPFETNYEMNLPEKQWKYMNDIMGAGRYGLEHDEVQEIFYDQYRECYYIVVRTREEDKMKEVDLRTKHIYPKSMITILDKNLKHMGDVFLPDDTYSTKGLFITEKGVYISEDHVNNPSFSEDYMRFRFFKLEKI